MAAIAPFELDSGEVLDAAAVSVLPSCPPPDRRSGLGNVLDIALSFSGIDPEIRLARGLVAGLVQAFSQDPFEANESRISGAVFRLRHLFEAQNSFAVAAGEVMPGVGPLIISGIDRVLPHRSS